MKTNFANLMAELRKGRSAVEAQAKLDELLNAVALTKKAGTLTFTLTVAPQGEDEEGEVNRFAFKDKVAIKAPEPENGVTILYRDDEGGLGRRDPRQPELPSIAERREASNG